MHAVTISKFSFQVQLVRNLNMGLLELGATVCLLTTEERRRNYNWINKNNCHFARADALMKLLNPPQHSEFTCSTFELYARHLRPQEQVYMNIFFRLKIY